jgi:hypothetical protein
MTSPTSGGRSVGTVRSRTQTMEFVFLFVMFCYPFLTVFHLSHPERDIQYYPEIHDSYKNIIAII